MKHLTLFVVITFLAVSAMQAQTVPQGIQYQAIARDHSGAILANKAINLQTVLLRQDDRGQMITEYSEIHEVTTNQLGLFTLAIGEGRAQSGQFSDVPWSAGEIWLELAIDENGGNDFTIISTNRLLTVPYAFHAGSAGTVSGWIDTRTPGDCDEGLPAQVWHREGNCNTDATVDKLGTTDCQDLVIVTDNMERLRITCAGDITIGGTVTASAFIGDGSGLTGIDVNDADSDPTNELQDWSTLPGIPAGFADGTDDVSDADADATNELNSTLGLNGTNLELTDAGGILSVDLSALGIAGNVWLEGGNTGTVNGTDFIGTTDNVDLDIRTNNVVRTRITTKGQIEVLNTGQSVFLGEGAGANDDLTNNESTFLGYQAGMNNMTGQGNTATGWKSMLSNTTGNWNTAYGAGSLNKNTTGTSNTAIGTDAMVSNTTGSGNTGVGLEALEDNSTGDNNTGVGNRVLWNNTTGDNNTAVGVTALSTNTTGYANSALGVNALLFNTTGYYNVALGHEAMFANQTGHSNTAVGRNSLSSN
ncbi:MAG: hypothetical protein R3330_07285, partial [Saprospiraceae bacterium]|nr:hypothetical protein [Saprospiraceae bacterium]